VYPVSNGSAARGSLLCRGGDNREASDYKQDGYADSHAHTFEVGYVKGHRILQASLSPREPTKLATARCARLRLDPLTAPDDRDRVTDANLTTARLLHPTPRQLIFNFADPLLSHLRGCSVSNG
jgi:hypothetical protein